MIPSPAVLTEAESAAVPWQCPLLMPCLCHLSPPRCSSLLDAKWKFPPVPSVKYLSS